MLSHAQALPVRLTLGDWPSALKESKQPALGFPRARDKYAKISTKISNHHSKEQENLNRQREPRAQKTQTVPTLQNLVHGMRPSGPALGPNQIKISFFRKQTDSEALVRQMALVFLLKEPTPKRGRLYVPGWYSHTLMLINCAFWRSLDMVPIYAVPPPTAASSFLTGSSPTGPSELSQASN